MKSTALLSLGAFGGAAFGTSGIAFGVGAAVFGIIVIAVVVVSARAVVVVAAKTGCGPREAAESVAVIVGSALGRRADPGESPNG